MSCVEGQPWDLAEVLEALCNVPVILTLKISIFITKCRKHNSKRLNKKIHHGFNLFTMVAMQSKSVV